MRASIQRQFGLIALLLVAAFAMPAIAHADSDEVMMINGAEVRVLVVGGKTYISVRSGTLKLNYPDGTVMADVPAGTSMVISGLADLPVAANGALTIKPTSTITIGLSEQSQPLTIHPDGIGFDISIPSGFSAGFSTMLADIQIVIGGHATFITQKFSLFSGLGAMSEIDRHELSASH